MAPWPPALPEPGAEQQALLKVRFQLRLWALAKELTQGLIQLQERVLDSGLVPVAVERLRVPVAW